MISLPDPLLHLIEHLDRAGIKPILVGGFVRDTFTGHPTNDLDIELYGVHSIESLETLLQPFGKLNLIGKSFGVLKLAYAGYTIDFAPPRTESKSGFGHKGFDVAWQSDIDFTDAARRRDFTINAIGYDPITKTLLDPFGGVEDLKNKRLMCVDPETFIDDPLRVLRAVQFAARFELTCDKRLLELCRSMIEHGALEELPKERIFEELKKLLLQSARPSLGLILLKEMGALAFLSPLDRFETTPQDPQSHPEGSVWNHLLMGIDVMASIRTGESKHDLILMLAMLLHDIGKPDSTIIADGVLNAPKHAERGVDIGRAWLSKITEDKSLIDAVLPLIRYHGSPRKLHKTHASDSEILRLSTHACIEDLIHIAKADFYGRTFIGTIPKSFEAGDWLFERAKALGVLYEPPQPLLMGRDLIASGLTPSETFKSILDRAYEAQLNQEFSTHEGALKWLVTVL
ncbi:HD domain-containing protein [Sulfuricurvum sp.]|uniref:CCA tRNA nucleotidyltransferase n=1 Tax=Sulfuricurvum sp. TaxID=2025608 RepID=UPI002633F5C9|nr:HD domain-containing protein [Sulfuricurvum sp.]MDD2267612.1 HD domain-containing protein [Sulfuricurvum sp.]MDD2783448.1 HD domain-containing protein [Sulfuricurvum sp.]